MTVAEMRARMSNREYVEWQALYARRAQLAELEEMRAQHRKG